jgi:chromosome segregation ATPase
MKMNRRQYETYKHSVSALQGLVEELDSDLEAEKKEHEETRDQLEDAAAEVVELKKELNELSFRLQGLEK